MKLVFDIGGTNFRTATLEKGMIASLKYSETPSHLNCSDDKTIIASICDMIASAYRGLSSSIPVGVCFPGPVSTEGSVVGSSVIFNKKPENPIPLQKLLRERLGTDAVYVINDMTAAAWCYIHRYRSFCIITISSGIGNKLVIDGKVRIGTLGLEGEIGHVRAFGVKEVDIVCPCGYGSNHLGSIASGRGVAEVANLLKLSIYENDYKASALYAQERISSVELAQAADADDVFARKVIDYCTRPLAHSICTLSSALFLEKYILIGGLVQHCSYYKESLVNNMIDFKIYNYSDAQIRGLITLGESDDLHGLLGMDRYLDFVLSFRDDARTKVLRGS